MKFREVKIVGKRCMRRWFVVICMVFILVTAYYFLNSSLLMLKCSSVGYYMFACQEMPTLKMTLNHPYACNQTHPIQLLALVISDVTHFRRRLTIRQTWGTIDRRSDTKVLFMLVSAQPIDYVTQRDILQEDHLYDDLIMNDDALFKSMSNVIGHLPIAVNWTFRHCPQSKFLLKIDDGSFLNPNRLYEYLSDVSVDIYSVRIPCCGGNYREIVSNDAMTPWASDKSLYLIQTDHIPQLVGTVINPKEILSSVLDEDDFVDLWAKKSGLEVTRTEGYEASSLVDLCVSRETLFIGRVSENNMRMFWWFVNDERLENCRTSQLVNTLIKNKIKKIS